MKAIRVELPAHLRLLAGLGREVTVAVDEIAGPVTQRSLLDALEAAYPMLAGTIRDHAADHKSKVRRPFMRFFACGEDLSHVSPDEELPEAVVSGAEAFLVVGAIAGG
jgi:molybdopterin synthase sulfur carrier subunit